MSIRSLYVLLLLFILPYPAFAAPEILLFSRIIDGTGEILGGTEIAVENGRILAVGNNLTSRYPDATVRDMKRLTALPGIIDVHTHLTYGLAGEPGGDAWSELGATPLDARLVAAARNAVKTLETGVTTIRDLNAGNNLDFYMRALIESGTIRGPRMLISGPGMHPSNEPSSRPGQLKDPVAEATAFAAARMAEGADWVKIFATSGSASDLTSRQQYGYGEIAAAVEIAAKSGRRVAVHTYGPEAVADAVRARVHSIEHATGLSDDLLRRIAEAGIVYVPTIDHNRYYADHAAEYGYDAEIKRNLHAFVERNLETVRRAHKLGVKIAMGSDAVLTGFGENTGELSWFIKAGMTPAEAIQTATVNGAELLGLENEIGRIAPGYRADIIAVTGNPGRDINDLITGVIWVMKEGTVVADKR